MSKIKLNCDMGEGMPFDSEIMPLIDQCNIACGGHAGDLETMKRAIDLALKHNVSIGVHPSFPDRKNFGRRMMEIPMVELVYQLVSQLSIFMAILENRGGKLHHIKPHGALYHAVHSQEKYARLFQEILVELELEVPIFTMQDHVFETINPNQDIILEAFADRRYAENGKLVSRTDPEALISNKEEAWNQVHDISSLGKVSTIDKEYIPMQAETFCVHSDSKNSLEVLRFLRQKIQLGEDA